MSRQRPGRGRYTPPRRPPRITWINANTDPTEHWANLGCTCDPEITLATTTRTNGQPLILIAADHHPQCQAVPRIQAAQN